MQKWISLHNLSIFLLSISAANAEVPSFEEVKQNDQSSEIIFLDRHGLEITTHRLNPKFRKLSWTKLTQIAPLAKKTLISVEDQHFFEHSGVDWFALVKSAVDLARGKNARGASTITMQLISLIDVERAKRGKRNFSQKLDQIEVALELEKKWTKEQILEAYLNLVPFRGEIIGIHATTSLLLKKDTQSLDPVDAAILVALLPSPNLSWEKISERACLFLRETRSSDLFCDETKKRINSLATQETIASEVSPHEYFRYYWIQRNKITEASEQKTSLDLPLQLKTLSFAKETIHSIQKQNVGEAAVIVLDHETGKVLTYLGNVPQFSKSPHVDGAQARRQAGSTLKPFFYGLALQDRKMNLDTVLIDEPIQIQTTNGAFRPDNYDHEFHGEVSFGDSLASSLNIPAIKVVQAIGVDESVALLKKLGFGKLEAGEVYGASIALGTVDVTLEELTHAYWQLSQQAFSGVAHAQSITRILSDRDARSITFGLNSVLNTPYFSAVKTGTSKDMRDNWCVGFSEKATVGVWVGNFNGNPMQDVSGVTGAAPLWRKVMDEIHQRFHTSIKTKAKLANIQKINLPAVRIMKKATVITSNGKENQILYPQERSVLALDPEIPEERQKLLLKSAHLSNDQTWYLNGEKIGKNDEPQMWKLSRGKFSLELRNSKNERVDQVSFLVK